MRERGGKGKGSWNGNGKIKKQVKICFDKVRRG